MIDQQLAATVGSTDMPASSNSMDGGDASGANGMMLRRRRRLQMSSDDGDMTGPMILDMMLSQKDQMIDDNPGADMNFMYGQMMMMILF